MSHPTSADAAAHVQTHGSRLDATTPDMCPPWCDVDHDNPEAVECWTDGTVVHLDGTPEDSDQSEAFVEVFLARQPGGETTLNLLINDSQRVTIPIGDGTARYLVDTMAAQISRAQLGRK